MFDRFTRSSRKAVILAQEEARHFNHDHIGTEHLLLGILRQEESVAGRALATLSVTGDEVRKQIESIVGRGEGETPFPPPFHRDAKKAMELALHEALPLGHNYIASEHLLLGLLRVRHGTATHILDNLGVERDDVRRRIHVELALRRVA